MKFKQNLLRKINSIAVGLGLFGFAAFTDAAIAEAPPKCITAIGTKVDGKYTKTAAEIGNEMEYCTETPERFVITIHELGLCTSQPIQTGTPRTFSRDNCVVTMTSTGTTADLANSIVSLPEMNGRPASNTYSHAYIILTNTFGLRGSVTIKNDAGGDVKYCSMTNKDESGSNSSGATTIGNFCTAENHTELLNNFEDEGSFSAYFPLDSEDGVMDGGGKVSALLTGADTNLTTATQESEAKRLIGVFETNSGSPVEITNATNGLEMQLTVTDIGYGITFTNGEPVFFGSMPFKPIFTTF
tara:strand:+ start:384 stop:1283 length:900 start_codon:yes stop_codon:yes gene_type:complete